MRRDRHGVERTAVGRLLSTKSDRPSTIAEEAATVVRRGGTVVFPTDTVYGIGCDPHSDSAIRAIYASKTRPANKPLSLHFGTVEELLEYASASPLAIPLARAFLPGALTIVVRRPSFVPAAVSAGLATVGLRVPKHRLCATILAACGPLAATSANASGSPAFVGDAGRPSDAVDADLWIDDGPTPLRIESTVVDVSEGDVRIIREGSITKSTIVTALGSEA